jgi:hypothetical protein
MRRIVAVNKALAGTGLTLSRSAKGFHLVQGEGTWLWPSSMIEIFRTEELTVEQWLAEIAALRGAR